MSLSSTPYRKITISLAPELVDFADQEAERRRISRSELISQAIAVIKAREEERLAAEGYQFYAQEAEEFAESSATLVNEALMNLENLPYAR